MAEEAQASSAATKAPNRSAGPQRFIRLFLGLKVIFGDTCGDTRSAMLYESVGERVDTRKPARGGLSGGVFSHVGTCENVHLVGRGDLNPLRGFRIDAQFLAFLLKSSS